MALTLEAKLALLDKAAMDDRLHPDTRATAARTAHNLRALEARKQVASGASLKEPGAE